jgi:HAD superfamily hydrolase (TIGR01509 family)
MTVKAIIFDMDGVLVDSEPVKAKVWQKVFKKYNVKNANKFFKDRIGNPGLLITEELIKLHNLRKSPSEILDEIHQDYIEYIKKYPPVPIKNSIEFLKSIDRNRYLIGLASSEYMATIVQQLHSVEICDYFDNVFSGKEDVARDKPNPDIYIMVAKKLGLLPSECIAVEDSEVGVLSAKSAGMKVIGFKSPNSGKQDLSGADHVYRNLTLIDLDNI